jgi:hypothetical protein
MSIEENKPKTLAELGKIMLKGSSEEELAEAYKIDASDLEEVGRQALLWKDIEPDGTRN